MHQLTSLAQRSCNLILSNSELVVFFLPLRPAVSLHNRNEPSTQHPSTKPPSSRSSEHYCNTTHQRQLIVSEAISDSTTHHDRAHNNGCDPLHHVFCGHRRGQVCPETMEAANCRRRQQVQPPETQDPPRKVSHNRPTCASKVRVLGGSSPQLITSTT